MMSKPKMVEEGGVTKGFLEEVINCLLNDTWEVQIQEPISTTKNGGKIHEEMRDWGGGGGTSSFMLLEHEV